MFKKSKEARVGHVKKNKEESKRRKNTRNCWRASLFRDLIVGEFSSYES